MSDVVLDAGPLGLLAHTRMSLIVIACRQTTAMRLAAELWAQARQQGQPTAANADLDADVILAAQTLSLGGSKVVVATTNVGHLSRFVPAELWQNIAP